MHLSPSSADSSQLSKLGWAWVAFCLALALHVMDEALTGFLAVYNPTILAIRPHGWWFPPTFEFASWLTGLIVAVLIALAFSPLFFRGVRWLRPVAYFLALTVGIFNALGHMTGTALGHTVMSVRFPRPMPGFYSSPFLLLASLYLLNQLFASGADKPAQRSQSLAEKARTEGC